MLITYEIKAGPDPRTLRGYYKCLAVVPFHKRSLSVVPRDQAPRNFFAAFLIDRMTELVLGMINKLDHFSIIIDEGTCSCREFIDTYERTHGTKETV